MQAQLNASLARAANGEGNLDDEGEDDAEEESGEESEGEEQADSDGDDDAPAVKRRKTASGYAPLSLTHHPVTAYISLSQKAPSRRNPMMKSRENASQNSPLPVRTLSRSSACQTRKATTMMMMTRVMMNKQIRVCVCSE